MSKNVETEGALDAFTKKANDFIYKNMKALKYGLYAAIAAGILFFGVDDYLDKQEKKAHEVISSAETALNKKLSKYVEDLDKENKDKKKAEEKVLNKENFSNFSAEFTSFEKALNNNKGTVSYYVAKYRLAELYYQFEQLDKSTEVLKSLIAESSDELIKSFSYMKLATVQMDQSKFEEAIGNLNKIFNFKKLEYLYSYVNLKIGICYQNLGKLDEAKESYTKNTEKHSKSKFTETSKNLLKLIELQKKGA